MTRQCSGNPPLRRGVLPIVSPRQSRQKRDYRIIILLLRRRRPLLLLLL